KKAVKKLFSELKDRFATRTGGYTRILRLPTTIRQAQADLPRGQKFNRSKFYGTRLGDNSTLVLWELCEAEVKPREKKGKAAKSKKAKPKAEAKPAAPKAAAKPKAPPPPAAEDSGEKTIPATKMDLGQK